MKNCTKHKVTIEKKCNSYVDCNHCAMEPVCLPIKTGTQSITLSDNYLSKRISTPPNSALFSKDEPLDSIYAVTSGVFKITDTNESFEEQILGFRFPGELIGEDAIYPKKYAYNAIAIGNSSVCKVVVSDLMACSNIVSDLQFNLIELLNRQSYISQKEFRALISRKSAESLLAAFLINITQRKSQPDHVTDVLYLQISRDNIANFLGLRRETLSRIFTKLQKDQLIEIQGKNIRLLELEKLTLLANL